MNRRQFIATSAALGALTYSRAADRSSDRIRVAVMGVRGRGKELIHGFATCPDTEVATLIDVDERVVPAAVKELAPLQKTEPKVEKDVRKVLEDPTIAALVVAAPDHWHALATIWACQAGKHVYCEKPASHNLVEGRRMVEAARKYNRVVQIGTQRRSGHEFHSAAEFIRSGKLGKTPMAECWIGGARKSIGHKADAKTPEGVDYDLWTGPAPLRPFNPNRFHYEWHWNWDYGTGEIGNNGIHYLDVCRMLLGLDAPTHVTSGGGKLFYDDDRQTPDTQSVTFDFPGVSVVWEHRIWAPKPTGDREASGVIIYGDKGTMVIGSKGWKVVDGPEAVDKADGKAMQQQHFQNFLDCVRSGNRPNADVEEGHKSTRLCHLGNIAYRTGRALKFDTATESIVDDAEANKLLRRSYRSPFVVPETV
ncbi:MAG TPA: Gfo/Idh/MocA family oxidoreductase [Gemmataceae bacterium]|jgi:predicted dehydrogenase|nr:Gfo/Idh/MocA family oxidoreductase [Gemmataceae bacterium]